MNFENVINKYKDEAPKKISPRKIDSKKIEYYIKKSTQTINYIKEVQDSDNIYYQFSFSKFNINEKIINSAIQQ